jgi:hypothetical protein
MSDMFEDIPVIHEVCNGQGCFTCDYQGEIVVRIELEVAA